jgi:flagellar basal body P-ring formation protein FlgA
MKKLAGLLVLVSCFSGNAWSQNQAVAVARQDTIALRSVVEQFLQVQTAGLPGQASFAIGAIDSRMNLPACAAPEAFLPPGSRVWGKTSVGVRCTAPSPWTVYISATVQIVSDYVITAAPLPQGRQITASDLTSIKGDLAALPSTIITDGNQAVGKTLSVSLPAGAPLRSDALKTQQAVQQGQMVKVTTTGPGFKVSTEARALNNAAEGQVTQVRTQSGQMVSGVARMGGIIEVTY